MFGPWISDPVSISCKGRQVTSSLNVLYNSVKYDDSVNDDVQFQNGGGVCSLDVLLR